MFSYRTFFFYATSGIVSVQEIARDDPGTVQRQQEVEIRRASPSGRQQGLQIHGTEPGRCPYSVQGHR
jgi:hypothetical protein